MVDGRSLFSHLHSTYHLGMVENRLAQCGVKVKLHGLTPVASRLVSPEGETKRDAAESAKASSSALSSFGRTPLSHSSMALRPWHSAAAGKIPQFRRDKNCQRREHFVVVNSVQVLMT